MKLIFDVPDELVRDIKTAVEDYIKLKQFPQQGDDFYFVCANGAIGHDTFARYATRDYGMYNFGNCFRTKEEAEFKREQLKVLHELEQLADDDQEWDCCSFHYYLYYDYSNEKICAENDYCCKNCQIYFKSRQSVQSAIDKIGEDRLKKYYFIVKESNDSDINYQIT